MSRRVLFVVPLTDEDELLYKLEKDSNHEMRGVTLHYRAKIEGRWYQVCRYDNAHGPPHVHRYWRKDEVEFLEPDLTPDAFVVVAAQSLARNWRLYRKLMEDNL